MTNNCAYTIFVWIRSAIRGFGEREVDIGERGKGEGEMFRKGMGAVPYPQKLCYKGHRAQ